MPLNDFGNLKMFTAGINQVFPGGALFLVCNEVEFKHFMMELTTYFLQQDHYRKVVAVKVIGKNCANNGDEEWIFPSSLQVDMSSTLVQPRELMFILLHDNPVTRSLQCPVFTPLDEGSALKDLNSAIEAFMPDMFVSQRWPAQLWVHLTSQSMTSADTLVCPFSLETMALANLKPVCVHSLHLEHKKRPYTIAGLDSVDWTGGLD